MNRLKCLRRGVALIGLGLCNLASAAVFTYENPAYTFELYSTGSTGFVGQTFTADGRLLRSTGGNGLYVHSATADTTINGTNTIHSAVLTSITGLGGGYGMTTGLDGKLYAMTSGGVKLVDLATNTATTLPGSVAGTYGLKTLPDGNLVYAGNNNVIYTYNLTTNTNSVFYTPGTFIDDVATDPSGNVFLAALGACRTDIVGSGGSLIRSVTTAHCADGMAFGNGSIYQNNTDGTITRLIFAGPNFSGAVTDELIASGGGYNDLASVGPDGAFYVTTQNARYANGSSAPAYSLVRVACAAGTPCFSSGNVAPPVVTNGVPEPASVLLLGIGLTGLALRKRFAS